MLHRPQNHAGPCLLFVRLPALVVLLPTNSLKHLFGLCIICQTGRGDWAEAALTATCVKNRSPPGHLLQTPWQLFYGRKPDVPGMPVVYSNKHEGVASNSSMPGTSGFLPKKGSHGVCES